jgi:hypothetical protein
VNQLLGCLAEKQTIVTMAGVLVGKILALALGVGEEVGVGGPWVGATVDVEVGAGGVDVGVGVDVAGRAVGVGVGGGSRAGSRKVLDPNTATMTSRTTASTSTLLL